MSLLASDAGAVLTYAWVPTGRGSGGSGTLTFDETYIAANDDDATYDYDHPGSFITYFASSALLDFSFTFDNGVNIEGALGFDGNTTVQNELGNTQFQALNGELRGYAGGSWSFEYDNNPNLFFNTYSGADVDQIICVRLPCPQAGAHFNFTGPAAAESNTGVFRLVAAPGLVGDYNGSGQVEQGDLDLVLQNWGVQSNNNVPAGWTNDLPTGQIEQTELDKVLQNWGNVAAPASVSIVDSAVAPEPAAAGFLTLAAIAVRERRHQTG